uniref:Uncharacterized protein n=1 Tax=Pavo cristatus TaxID=9049 RepID=A0A8C9FLD9_PAVCR
MAGVSDAAAPGGGGEGRRGGGPEQLQQDGCRGEPKTLWGSSELRPPPAGLGQPSPQQRTETLGFYESDRGRKKKRGLSVDVFWNLFVPGCFSVYIHPASSESFSGNVPVHHFALLWITYFSICLALS